MLLLYMTDRVALFMIKFVIIAFSEVNKKYINFQINNYFPKNPNFMKHNLHGYLSFGDQILIE